MILRALGVLIALALFLPQSWPPPRPLQESRCLTTSETLEASMTLASQLVTSISLGRTSCPTRSTLRSEVSKAALRWALTPAPLLP